MADYDYDYDYPEDQGVGMYVHELVENCTYDFHSILGSSAILTKNIYVYVLNNKSACVKQSAFFKICILCCKSTKKFLSMTHWVLHEISSIYPLWR